MRSSGLRKKRVLAKDAEGARGRGGEGRVKKRKR
jgi:hypothetical protein